MGLKIIEKKKSGNKLSDKKKELKKVLQAIDNQNKSVKSSYEEIGRLVVAEDTKLGNENIEKLKEKVVGEIDNATKLMEEKKNIEKDIYELEETLRNLEGKVGCPNCGKVYEKKKDLEYCSKCGAKLETRKI